MGGVSGERRNGFERKEQELGAVCDLPENRSLHVRRRLCNDPAHPEGDRRKEKMDLGQRHSGYRGDRRIHAGADCHQQRHIRGLQGRRLLRSVLCDAGRHPALLPDHPADLRRTAAV